MSGHRPTRGFTLLEIMAAVVVLSIITVVVFPVMQTLLASHTESVSSRQDYERATFAIDRVMREIREIGIDDSGNAELTTMDSDELIEASGAGIRLSGSDLMLVDTSSVEHPLCSGVDAFTLAYIGRDGTTTTADLAEVWTVRITLTVGDAEFGTIAFIRERIGGG